MAKDPITDQGIAPDLTESPKGHIMYVYSKGAIEIPELYDSVEGLKFRDGRREPPP